MTSKMTPRASRDLPGQKPRIDKARETQEALIEDAPETEDRDRDLAHGDGGSIGIPTKPGDLSRDD